MFKGVINAPMREWVDSS